MLRPATSHPHRHVQAVISLAILIAIALATEAGKRWL